MGVLPKFHAKAIADTQARTESAVDERRRADEFLSSLDDLLSEGVGEIAD